MHRLSRRGISGIIAGAFVLAIVVVILALIFIGLNRINEVTQLHLRYLEERSKIMTLQQSVYGYYNISSYGTLDINITNNYREAILITAIGIVYSDGQYDIISRNLTTASMIIAELCDVVGTCEEIDTFTLPIGLPTGYTLHLELYPKSDNILTISASIGGSPAVITIPIKPYVPTAIAPVTPAPIYRITYAPRILGEGSWAVLGYEYSSTRANASSITVEEGIYVSGTIDDIKELDNQYYIIDGAGISNWLSGWSYRRRITITNYVDRDLVNYSIKIVLDRTFSWDKVKHDGSDIRFTDDDGVTHLPHWIEEWDYGAKAIIWVKVPLIPASSTKTIYMYYGNPIATSPGYTPEDVFTLIGECGLVSTNENGITVEFVHEYPEPPIIIASINTFNEPDAVVSRIIKRATTNFTIWLEEYPSSIDNGSHVNETIGWIALKPGIWVVGDKIWEVGTINVDNTWKSVTFKYTFSKTPAIMTYINSYNEGGVSGSSESGAHTRQRNPSNTAFEVKIEEERDTPHPMEVVGYLAVEIGEGTTANGLKYIASTVPVLDIDWFGWITYPFPSNYFETTPVVIFKIMTERDDANCHERLRYVSINSFQYGLQDTPAFYGPHFPPEWGGFLAIEPGSIYGYEYVYPGPSVIIGDEEINKVITSCIIDFTGVSTPTVRLNISIALMYNVSNIEVKLYLWNYSSLSWVKIFEDLYMTSNTMVKYRILVFPDEFVAENGSLKLKIVSRAASSFRTYIDMVKLHYYEPRYPLIVIGAGGSDKVLKYNIETHNWSYCRDAPFNFSKLTPMTYDYDRALLWSVDATGYLYKYDMITDSWSLVTSAPRSPGNGSALIYLDDKLYYIVGSSKEFYCYDIDLDTFKELSPTPYDVNSYSSGITNGTCIYLIFGGSANFSMYDPLNDEWFDLEIAPTSYVVSMTWDKDRKFIWIIGKGGGIHYFSVMDGKWYPYRQQIPYIPQSEGNRLIYYNNKLYHIRADNTRELWVISVG